MAMLLCSLLKMNFMKTAVIVKVDKMITHWILAAKLTDFTKKLSLMLVYLLMPLVVFFLTVRIKLPSRLVLFVYVPFLPSRCESGFTGERCAETLPMRVFIPERM